MPTRTCVGCRTARPATQLWRCTIGPDGVAVLGRTSRGLARPGRGAWVCSPACFDDAARRGRFARTWRRQVTPAALAPARDQLLIAFESLPSDMEQWTAAGRSPGASAPTKG